VLASGSPRRRELLDQLGVCYRSETADIDETPLPGESPRDCVQRLAREKAARVAARLATADAAVLAADTAVVLDDDLLGKPASRAEALGMLARLSGRSHAVLTGICLRTPDGAQHVEVVETQVTFLPLTLAQCEAYLASGESWDKAGGYAIQGLAGAFVSAIEGSCSNVVGLPLAEVWRLLSGHGIPTALERRDE